MSGDKRFNFFIAGERSKTDTVREYLTQPVRAKLCRVRSARSPLLELCRDLRQATSIRLSSCVLERFRCGAKERDEQGRALPTQGRAQARGAESQDHRQRKTGELGQRSVCLAHGVLRLLGAQTEDASDELRDELDLAPDVVLRLHEQRT